MAHPLVYSEPTGRKYDAPLSMFLVLSMTLWWYSYSPCEKFMRTGGHRVSPSTQAKGPHATYRC